MEPAERKAKHTKVSDVLVSHTRADENSYVQIREVGKDTKLRLAAWRLEDGQVLIRKDEVAPVGRLGALLGANTTKTRFYIVHKGKKWRAARSPQCSQWST